MFDLDGRICAREPQALQLTMVGGCQLVAFPNPDGLEEMLPGVYAHTGCAGTPTLANPGDEGVGTCLPGWIELRDPQRKNSAPVSSLAVIVAFLLGAILGLLIPSFMRRPAITPRLPAPAGGA
jgi:hypothetical protein